MYSSEKMSSPSDDTDDLMIDPLAEELRNIESVINVTSRNIDALNAKFANRQDPPPMYISEYQELTSRLHELEEKKIELTEKMQQNESPEPPEESLEVNFRAKSIEIGWMAIGTTEYYFQWIRQHIIIGLLNWFRSTLMYEVLKSVKSESYSIRPEQHAPKNMVFHIDLCN